MREFGVESAACRMYLLYLAETLSHPTFLFWTS